MSDEMKQIRVVAEVDLHLSRAIQDLGLLAYGHGVPALVGGEAAAIVGDLKQVRNSLPFLVATIQEAHEQNRTESETLA